MSNLKYPAAAAAALALLAIPVAAQAGTPSGDGEESCNEFQFSDLTGQGVADDSNGLDFRRAGERRRRLSHKRPKCNNEPFNFNQGGPQSGNTLSWNYGSYFDSNEYSLDAAIFATDWLTVSGNIGGFRNDDSYRLTGIDNDGYFLGGGVTAYATENFALDAFIDYTNANFYGRSANTYVGGEYLPFSGVPLTLRGGYDRMEFLGGVYDKFSLGFTTYLGAPAKNDLRSYHRGQ